MPSSFARPDPLASPDWLAERLTRPGVRVLDCRWQVDGAARLHFAQGHIPGAVQFDWATELVDPAGGPGFTLAPAERFASAMTRAGVGDDMTVVVYDDTQSLYAARVWWSLQAYGFRAVHVLDGGWPAWLESGRPVSEAAPAAPAPADAPFTPRPAPYRRVTTPEMAEIVHTGGALIIDARTPSEYVGQAGAGPRRGHISGAVNMPAALLAEPGSHRLPPADELARTFAQHGVTRGRRIVTYDAAGVGAAKVCFVMELLGYDDVALYDAGWAGWIAGDDYPVEP